MGTALTDFRRDVEDQRVQGFARGWFSETFPSISKLEGDELDIVGLVVERLSLGRGIYGQWVASAELRDLERESLDEELDDVVYRAMRTVIRRRTPEPRFLLVDGALTQEKVDEIRQRFTEQSGRPALTFAPEALCSHTGHAGGREGHLALVRSSLPWWRRLWR